MRVTIRMKDGTEFEAPTIDRFRPKEGWFEADGRRIEFREVVAAKDAGIDLLARARDLGWDGKK